MEIRAEFRSVRGEEAGQTEIISLHQLTRCNVEHKTGKHFMEALHKENTVCILRKCPGKYDYLIYDMLFIYELYYF